jgi:hypothetical protein
MSFKEKSIVVSLVNFSLILLFFLFRVIQMALNDSFTEKNVFTLWGIIIVLAVVVTFAATIMTVIVSAVIEAILTGGKEPKVDGLEDERDRLIDLKGTQVSYLITSLGGLLAMLTYVLDQPPLIMFTLFIFFSVVAQITGDVRRLALYRGGL